MLPEALEEELRHAIKDALPHTASIARGGGLEQRENAGIAAGAGASPGGNAGTAATRSIAPASRTVRARTFEGALLNIEFCPSRGWLVLPKEDGNTVEEAEVDPGTKSVVSSSVAPGHQVFESLHALLSSRSPLYCASFQRAVFAKLSGLDSSSVGSAEQ